jgi:hypothetical protein
VHGRFLDAVNHRAAHKQSAVGARLQHAFCAGLADLVEVDERGGEESLLNIGARLTAATAIRQLW